LPDARSTPERLLAKLAFVRRRYEEAHDLITYRGLVDDPQGRENRAIMPK
jgi:hypothetical protein